MNPQNTLLRLNEVREEINKMALSEIVNHKFITTQLQVFFGDERSESIIQQFKANYMILISDQNVIKSIGNADKFTIIQSLINLTKDNLSINPYDKECCLVNYGGRAVAIPMWRGRLKKMQERGIIRYLDYLEVVYEGDICENTNGRWKHSMSLNRKPNAKMQGVLLIAVMSDGRSRSKFVHASAIEKRRLKSKMPKIWDEWADEMWKKTAITIFEAEIGSGKLLSYSEDFEEDFEEETLNAEHTELVVEQPNTPHQDPILRGMLDSIIEDNPEVLNESEKEKLLLIIDSLDDSKLQIWINSLNNRLNKKIDSPI